MQCQKRTDSKHESQHAGNRPLTFSSSFTRLLNVGAPLHTVANLGSVKLNR